MIYLSVRSWDIYEKDLDDVVLSVKELDPTILDRWKPVDSRVTEHITFCDNINNLIEQANIPEGVEFRWVTEDCFAILVPVEVPIPEIAKKLWPDEQFGQDRFGDIDQ